MDYKYPEQIKTRRRFWTEQEDNILAHGIRTKKSYKQISKLVNRSEAACTQRAFHLRESFSKNNAVARKVSVEPKPVPAKPKAQQSTSQSIFAEWENAPTSRLALTPDFLDARGL